MVMSWVNVSLVNHFPNRTLMSKDPPSSSSVLVGVFRGALLGNPTRLSLFRLSFCRSPFCFHPGLLHITPTLLHSWQTTPSTLRRKATKTKGGTLAVGPRSSSRLTGTCRLFSFCRLSLPLSLSLSLPLLFLISLLSYFLLSFSFSFSPSPSPSPFFERTIQGSRLGS